MQPINVFEFAKFYHSNGLVPIPIPHRGKGPKIDEWQKRTLETPITEREFTQNSNIGILCGEVSGVMVLDIDIKNRGLEIFNELLAQEDINEDSLTRVATTGSGGKHLFFQYNPAFSRCGTKVVSLNGVAIGWDIKSNTGQVVVEPSLHKDTAVKYEFNEVLDNFRASIKPMPDWLYTILDAGAMTDVGGYYLPDYEYNDKREQVRPQSRADVKYDPTTIEDLEKFVSLLAVSRWSDYETWINIGLAIYNETNGSDEGRELWKRCSRAKYEHYNGAEHDRKWRSFRGGQRENPITIGTIKRFANEDAPDQYALLKGQIRVEKVVAVDNAIVAANPLPPILDRNNRVFFNNIEQHLGQNPTIELVVEKLRQIIAYISNGGKTIWITKNWNSDKGHIEYTRIKREDMSDSKLSFIKFPLGHGGKPISLFDIIREHYSVFEFNKRVFKPCRDVAAHYLETKNFNEFSGFKHDETGVFDPVIVEKINKHFREIFTGEDVALFEYLINWHAWIVQCMDRKMVKCLVVRGTFGTGKTSWFHWFGNNVVGNQYFNEAEVSNLMSNFNSIIENKLLVVVNESRNGAFTSPEAENKFKQMISDETYNINPKGKDIHVAANHTNFVICTNHQYPIKIDPEDRRFVAFDSFPIYKGNTAYWKWAHKELLNDANAAHYYNYLLSRDLSEWDYDKIPKTEARDEIKWDSQPAPVRWLRDYYLTIDNDEEFHAYPDVLFQQFNRWRDENVINVRPSKDCFLKQIKPFFGCNGAVPRIRIDGERKYALVVRRAALLAELNKLIGRNVLEM